MVLQSQTINQQVEMVQNWQTATVSTGAHRQKDGSMIDKLDQQVKQWPTPEASQGGRQGGSFSQNSWKKEDGTPKQPSLAQATIMDQQVKNWATPRVHEHMEPPHQWQARNIKKKAENPKLGTLDKPLGTMVMEQQKKSGKLNPRWVETLMGLPVGWTMPSCASPVTIERMSCDCSATALSRQQRSEPSEH
jgi:hypothetical protein